MNKDELLKAVATPTMTDQIHILLLDSLDKIADGWVGQLNDIRGNIDNLEKQILVCVARVKDDVTKLHNLGGQLTMEVGRGQAVIRQIFTDIEKLSPP